MLLDKVTLLIIIMIHLCSMKTRHRDIAMTTSPDYRAVETSIQ